jgi:cytochrome c oxidase subunit IV
MIFGFIMLLTAITISVISAYYSVTGLAAIFAGAATSVIVMAASLEFGKIVATVWLHNNWKRAPIAFKLYLVPAIIFLMFLTSMGIFGGLSKAHLEQGANIDNSSSQVAIYDEKIKIVQDNINSARLALKQMDATVDQTIARSTDAGGVQIAAQLRKRQAKERFDLQNTITVSQQELTVLREKRAPLATQLKKVEVDIGPIKYIAALLYGDNPDANLLERAVRWVIILIVIVFDPLALCLILAANLQFEWARHGKGGFVHDEEEKVEHVEQFHLSKDEDGNIMVPNERIPPMPYIVPPAPAVTSWTTTTTETVPEPIPGAGEDDAVEEVFEMPSEWDTKRHAFSDEPAQPPVIDESLLDEEQPLTTTLTDPVVVQAALEAVFKDRPEYFVPAKTDPQADIPTAMGNLEPIPEIPGLLNLTDDEQPEMIEVVTEHIDPNTRIKTSVHSWVPAPVQADNVEGNVQVAADFGTLFPANAKKGDMYLRVDYLPTRLFKFNGQTWMHIDKTASDSYTYNEEYVKYLVAKIDSGEYSLDDLTETEQDQIAEYLNKNEQHN